MFIQNGTLGDILFKDVLFDFFDVQNTYKKQHYIINLFKILAKFHIHKSQFSSKKLLFPLLLIEIINYVDRAKSSTDARAVKTFQVLGCVKLLDP